jgi:hypothetical protein
MRTLRLMLLTALLTLTTAVTALAGFTPIANFTINSVVFACGSGSYTVSITYTGFGADFFAYDILDDVSGDLLASDNLGGGDVGAPAPGPYIFTTGGTVSTSGTIEIIFTDGGGESRATFSCTEDGAAVPSGIPLRPADYVCGNPQATVFINERDGLSIYRLRVPADANTPYELSVRVTIAELSDLSESPERNQAIEVSAGGYFTGFYQLSDGIRLYQVNLGPDEDGDVLTCIWEGWRAGQVELVTWNTLDVLRRLAAGEDLPDLTDGD